MRPGVSRCGGRRIVFSPLDKRQNETGEWCMVVYLWGNNRTWVEASDVRKLIMGDTLHRLAPSDLNVVNEIGVVC